MRSVFQVMLMLIAFVFTSFAFQSYGHEMENEHVHCGENGQKCPTEEDKVRGYYVPPPNSSPTPYTGGNAPTNSASDNCEGSGCINYDENYRSQFSCGPGEKLQIVPLPYGGEHHMCVVDNPPCPQWLKNATLLGGIIGTSTVVPVTPDKEDLIDIVTKSAPAKVIKWVRIASGWSLIIDLTVYGYCELNG